MKGITMLDQHPLRKMPGTGRATWDYWMGRWVVLPHVQIRMGSAFDYALKPEVKMVKASVNRGFSVSKTLAKKEKKKAGSKK